MSALAGFLILLTLLLLPLLVVGALFRVAFALLLLPFRLVGAVLQIALAGAGLFLKLIVGIGAVLVGLVLVPLFPLVLLALMAWLFVKVVTPARVRVC